MNALYPQGTWDLDDRLTVVLFAGMGGACDGLEDAGFPVHLAINHDPLAIAVHERRHPHTRHLRNDVFEVCPREATGGRGVRILHASPDCTHFSVAKGSKPVSKRRRSLAWVVCRWAGQVRPETVTMENVREITTWGPLVAKRDPATGRVLRLDGTVAAKGERVPVEQQWLTPDKRHKGRIWRAWLRHLRGLGFSFDYRVLNCADYGIPTIRTRFFGVAHADGRQIHWPERTHAPRAKHTALGLKPWVGFDTCIDWSLPVTSIFERPKPHVVATKRRIARGVVRYVVTAAKPFIVPITHAGDIRVRSMEDPSVTWTTAHRGEMALVAATLVQTGYGEREGQAPRVLDLQAPAGTQVAGGSKAALVAAFLAQHSGGTHPGQPAKPVIEPLSTLTATPQQGIVMATLGSLRGTNIDGRDLGDPAPAQSAGGHHELLILPFLQAYYQSGTEGQRVDDPLRALTAKARHGLVTVEVDGITWVITDICTRMIDPLEGARAHGFDPKSLLKEIDVTDKRGRVTRRPPNKTEICHLVGNSVPPRMVQLLAECNVRRTMPLQRAKELA